MAVRGRIFYDLDIAKMGSWRHNVREYAKFDLFFPKIIFAKICLPKDRSKSPVWDFFAGRNNGCQSRTAFLRDKNKALAFKDFGNPF